MKTRRLTDLYVVGKEISFDDGLGPVTIYLKKLNSVDQEEALRRANAARSKVFAAVLDPDSLLAAVIDEQMSAYVDRDDFVDVLVADEMAKKAQAIEAEVASADEWTKDDYLQGVRDAWLDDMAERYQQNNEDEEAKPVFEAMQKFVTQVNEATETIEAQTRVEVEDFDDDELYAKVKESRIMYEANIAWIKEYRRCEVWLSVRDSKESRERYFVNREETDDLPTEVFTQLSTAYRALSVEPTEGKSLPGTPASSTQSESPVPAAAVPSSGPVTASA